MKNNVTELVFILDKSGSMHGLEKDTIGGFNSMIEKQKQVEGQALISTVLFSSHSEVIHDRIELSKINELDEKDYVVGGCTALIDAIGGAIKHIRMVHKYIRQEDVPEHTIFVIMTDGMENASHMYSSNEVKQMITQQKKKGWEFIFLGANIDTVETAASFGIEEEKAVSYHSDPVGTALNYDVLSDAVCQFRTSGTIRRSWRKKIDEDFKNR